MNSPLKLAEILREIFCSKRKEGLNKSIEALLALITRLVLLFPVNTGVFGCK